MRLLFCLDFYHPHVGGAEVLFTSLAEGLVSRGHQVHVVTQALPGCPAHEERNGVQITRVRTFGTRYLMPIAAPMALIRLARQADIIHTTTFASTLPAWLTAKITRKPLVLTVHEVWVDKWDQVSDASCFSNTVNNAIESAIYALNYQNYVTVSHATARDLEAIGTPGERITTIYNGVDYDFWNPERHDASPLARRSPDEHLFFFTGRPGVSKGLPVLLKALSHVVKQCPKVHLLAIVSHAPAVRKGLEQAKQLISDLQLEQYVTLEKPVPYNQLPGIMKCADTVVVPSLSEGFGFVAAEACALGRPVIATDNASLPEVVSGKTLLVPPRDETALADAMLRAVRGDYLVIPPRRFPLSDNLDQHLALYSRILSSRGT